MWLNNYICMLSKFNIFLARLCKRRWYIDIRLNIKKLKEID